MEAKNNKKDGQAGESFVTGSYLKQLEIQKEGQLITAVEEELNKKKTANEERGMTGFYTNYLSKIRGVVTDDADHEASNQKMEQKVEETKQESLREPAATAPKDFRGKMEDKLKELRQK